MSVSFRPTPSFAAPRDFRPLGLDLARTTLLLIAFGAGCGGAAQTAVSPRAPMHAALPALPDAPLQLVPIGARLLAGVDLERLRASPHFATLEGWAQRYVCLEREPSRTLLSHTRSALLALFDAEGGGSSAVALLRGDYATEDARKAIAQACASSSTRCEPVSQQLAGRFTLLAAGPLSSVLLGDHLLAVGDSASVRAVIEVADGKRRGEPSADPLMRGLDTAPWLSDHTLAVLARLDDRAADRIAHELESIGGSGLGAGLANGSAALGLVLAGDASANARVLYPAAGSAARTAEGIRTLVAQAGLVMRLMGLPPLLDHLQVSTQGGLLLLSLELSAADVRSLREQLAPMLRGEPAACKTAGSGAV